MWAKMAEISRFSSQIHWSAPETTGNPREIMANIPFTHGFMADSSHFNQAKMIRQSAAGPDSAPPNMKRMPPIRRSYLPALSTFTIQWTRIDPYTCQNKRPRTCLRAASICRRLRRVVCQKPNPQMGWLQPQRCAGFCRAGDAAPGAPGAGCQGLDHRSVRRRPFAVGKIKAIFKPGA